MAYSREMLLGDTYKSTLPNWYFEQNKVWDPKDYMERIDINEAGVPIKKGFRVVISGPQDYDWRLNLKNKTLKATKGRCTVAGLWGKRETAREETGTVYFRNFFWQW
jgi:hypothetical protein